MDEKTLIDEISWNYNLPKRVSKNIVKSYKTRGLYNNLSEIVKNRQDLPIPAE